MGLDSAYRWARGVEDARIGLAGTVAGFQQFGFYGTDLSNRVIYLGADGAEGAFNAIPSCRQFREAFNDADLDYLVTSPFLNFVETDEPVHSPEAAWLREAGAPVVEPIVRGNGVTVWKVEAKTRPRGLRPAQPPLARDPDRYDREMSGSYPVENALFQWEDGWRALQALADDPPARRRAERFVDSVRDELRHRVGVTFTTAELADFYGTGTDWCLQLAMETAPAMASGAQSLADAGFWLYLRGATDFAGGRRLAV